MEACTLVCVESPLKYHPAYDGLLTHVRYPDGTEADLEIARHPGAAGIVPFLTDPEGDDPQILMLRQYRYAAGGYIYEIPAGRLDPGEAPIACAARELKEETGCSAKSIVPLITVLTSKTLTCGNPATDDWSDRC